jgi:UDP-3-O-[3-hydroxymyristoyl] glucosamine N-acyltransferase
MAFITLAALAERLGLEYKGSGETSIDHVAGLNDAGRGSLTFLADRRYRKHLAATRAAVVVMEPDLAGETTVPVLLAPNPHLAFARAAAIVMPARRQPEGVHPTAWVDPEAVLGYGVAVGPHASIGRGSRIGDGVRIGPGCVIGEEVEIGEGSRLVSRVTVWDRCIIGRRCVLQPGAVIGGDGFGYAIDQGRWEPVPQLGRVRLGDDVDVGANTTIDRGAIGDTILENGVKLDNQVQIGHNVQIGEHTIIVACAGIAGSTRIGKHCAIGGAVGIAGHLTIADGVQMTGMTQVTKSLKEPGVYSSGTGVEPNGQWRRNAARFHQLDDIAKRLRDLERQVKAQRAE